MTKIVGTWRLTRAESVASDSSLNPAPFGGEKAMGRLTFNDDGRMMSVVCDGRPALPAGTAREYRSYCGNYAFDGSELVTRVDAATDAGRIGLDQVRGVTFENDLMVLRPPPSTSGGRAEQWVLYWKKIADV